MTSLPPPLPTAAATNNNNISWRHFCDKLLKNKKTKTLFIYLCLNTIGLIFQVIIAWTSNSLALLGHAFHTMFDCIGVVVACAGEIYYHHDDENDYFTFGLSRVPVLAAFTNAAFLFFTATFLALQVLHRLSTPQVVKPWGLVFVVFFGLVIKLLGLFLFIQGGLLSLKNIFRNGSISNSNVISSSNFNKRNSNLNMEILLIGVFSDLIRSAGILITSSTLHLWQHSDTAASLIISFLMVRTVLPTLQSSAKILLQCAPDTTVTKATVERCVRHLSNIEGVLEVREERYWTIDGTACTGTFCIRAHENADEQAILKKAEILCKPTFKYLNVQIEKDPPTTWFLSKRNT
eukprot:g5497.t1